MLTTLHDDSTNFLSFSRGNRKKCVGADGVVGRRLVVAEQWTRNARLYDRDVSLNNALGASRTATDSAGFVFVALAASHIDNYKRQVSRHKCQFKSTAHFRPSEPNYRRDCRRYSLMLSPRPGAKTKRSRILDLITLQF
jgi:hypothetical protein